MQFLSVRGAAEHNLKNLDVDLPRGALVVVTGVSGSGKSSLAFDTIFREAERRYLETFSSYARQFLGRMSRPAARGIDGLSPAIAVDQRSVLRQPRSTVGTLSGLYDDLRLLFARLGTAPAGVHPRRRLFSFNTPQGACPSCRGLGVEDRLDPALLVADPRKSIRQGALRITTPTGYVIYSQVTIDVLDQVCRAHGFDVDTPWSSLTDEQRRVVLGGSDRIRIAYGKHPLESRLRWSGITARPREEGVYKGVLPVMEQILKRSRNRNILRFVRSLPCRACGGSRLRPEALAVHFRGRDIGEMARLTIGGIQDFFAVEAFEAREAPVGESIRAAVLGRTRLLARLGIGHLSLDRDSPSLSGGEAQRLRLASQLGSGLRGVLYVLDEPSIGLHPREHADLLGVLHELRDLGNTVLVVEHDEDTIRRADWVVDVGPGAGEHGGELLYSGPPAGLCEETASEQPRAASRLSQSRTAAFLSGRERPPIPQARRAGTGVLRLTGATRHNLRQVDVEFLLGAFNVVTGVSGAGKSSLVEELLARLADGAVEGGAAIGKVIAVDQSPIGRTPRSNPATYTGLSDAVRDLFASTPAAMARSFGKGRFSFNVPGGRCEACQGAGVQQVGMHFLGAVNVVCEACGGRRFNDETLAVAYRGRNIHDVLEMTLEEAAPLLAADRRAARILRVLRELGLGYLRLGQPSTTLSGGEAQRVKLAAELSRPGRGHTLYVLDEPTTGLHVADVVVLVNALDRLVDQGHTVLVIEHHLDIVRWADRVIDLGPGGGATGGRVVVSGTPEEVAAHPHSSTGAALRATKHTPGRKQSPAPSPQPLAPDLILKGVTTHNLKSIDVTIPANTFTVVTGVSGSGKSSLAFDTIFSEGRNRFIESFSAYGRRFLDKRGEAELEAASGLTPTVAIRQRSASRNPRSTVGTMTEIADYYRLLFARVGENSVQWALGSGQGAAGSGQRDRSNPLALSPQPLAPVLSSCFSPNSEQGACPACKGLGTRTECDPAKLVSDPSRPLTGGAMDGTRTGRFYGDPFGQHVAILRAAGAALGIDFDRAWSELEGEARRVAMDGTGDREFEVEWRYKRGTRTGVHRFRRRWLGFAGYVNEEYERKHADRRGEAMEALMRRVPCPVCGGTRLKPERLSVLVAGRHIAAWLAMTVDEALAFLEGIEADAGRAVLGPRDAAVSGELRAEVGRRLRRLQDAGLGYLSLDRPAATLSAGEAQRVRLAADVGSGLTGITYVLDEPTAGLHPRDTARLLHLVRGLRDAGNTVIVVEHDAEVIRAADHVIDLGPGAGEQGGRVVAAGTPEEVARVAASPTGRYLAQGARARAAASRRVLGPGMRVTGATLHNLQGLDVEVPAGGLVAVTGVSGSGKSTLVFDVIAPAIARLIGRIRDTSGHTTSVAAGLQACSTENVALLFPFSRLVSSDGDPSSFRGSSTVAGLTGAFDDLRTLFAASEGGRERGLTKTDFSLTVKGGRCEACEGQGQVRVSMDFLPDVFVPCEECGGRRFGPRVLSCRVEGRSIADALDLTIAQAREAFGGEAIAGQLAPFEELGLGYLRLGQTASTLSGGERQRLRLAAELAASASRGRSGASLFLFDEPTTGLHGQDVGRLLQVFDRLLSAGHTIVCVEHNLDVIRAADWVIDLGPEGGTGGGRLVAAGTPEDIAGTAESWTGRALAGREVPTENSGSDGA